MLMGGMGFRGKEFHGNQASRACLVGSQIVEQKIMRKQVDKSNHRAEKSEKKEIGRKVSTAALCASGIWQGRKDNCSGNSM
jgi:hypothetical protein